VISKQVSSSAQAEHGGHSEVRRTISIKIFDVLVLAGSVAATGSVVILFFLMARNLCSDTFLAMGMSVNNDTEAGTLLMPGTVCVNTAMTCVRSFLRRTWQARLSAVAGEATLQEPPATPKFQILEYD
jgi:hypothetical protein